MHSMCSQTSTLSAYRDRSEDFKQVLKVIFTFSSHVFLLIDSYIWTSLLLTKYAYFMLHIAKRNLAVIYAGI